MASNCLDIYELIGLDGMVSLLLRILTFYSKRVFFLSHVVLLTCYMYLLLPFRFILSK